ncbi:hypothetical protein P7C71_g3949, partial [Lecanoromycetidae sp. Uapishka_2]
MDHSRDPCPWVALSDFGGAFCMGGIGGAVWHGVKGFRNSPYGERRIGAVTAIKARAPVLGGNFGLPAPPPSQPPPSRGGEAPMVA